jgi:hypothetical protein
VGTGEEGERRGVACVVEDGFCVENEMINTLLVFLLCREGAAFSNFMEMFTARIRSEFCFHG